MNGSNALFLAGGVGGVESEEKLAPANTTKPPTPEQWLYSSLSETDHKTLVGIYLLGSVKNQSDDCALLRHGWTVYLYYTAPWWPTRTLQKERHNVH